MVRDTGSNDLLTGVKNVLQRLVLFRDGPNFLDRDFDDVGQRFILKLSIFFLRNTHKLFCFAIARSSSISYIIEPIGIFYQRKLPQEKKVSARRLV